ncbi:peripheral inner membrane phage-shock protein [Serratia symbiotica]|uniref:Peripheral inner membrane phage-shock protein n=2 Tax=Serratia symbiotica TaxID=138074 RepID=A0A455VLJ4_9GAMM|nr:peripheral inner membrane phage-shock protein [Serratia symbiotica]
MLIALLNYGPAGTANWLLKAVGRKPIRVVLALVLELLFRKGLSKVLGRDAKGN